VASICSTECSWLLRRSRACFQSQISFLIRQCAYLVVSAHISLQVKHLTQVCEGEKQSQLLSTTLPLWFYFRDKFLSFMCCGTSCFKNHFSSQCQKESVSYSNQYCRIFSSIYWPAREPRGRYCCLQWQRQPSHLSWFSMIHLDVLLLQHSWLNNVYFHRYVDLKANLHWEVARSSRARFFVCFIESGKSAPCSTRHGNFWQS